MNRLTSALVAGMQRFPEAEHGIDDQGYTTHHPLWPEQAEIIYGGLASLIVIGLLIWKAGPLLKKAMAARTDKIQVELDDSAAAKRDAEAEAARIRQSLGNIDAERQRVLADADAQAQALLADGRTRLDAEAAELEAKAQADIAAGAGRAGDELRGEIARLAGAAADLVVERSLDDATQQQLIEAYIAKVGATTTRNVWSKLMSDDASRFEGYANGLFEIAKAEGTLDEVEDELFRFARSYESSDELRNALTDELVPVTRRQSIVEDLLGGKASPTTAQLVSMIVGSGRGRDLPAIVDRLVQRAAATKDATVAEVRTAVPLSADQQDRLRAALANATGRNITVKAVVDPSVLGGVVATVGDTVIDGTVRTHLEQLKSRL